MGEADDLERVVCYGTGSSNPLFSSGESRKPASASPVEQPLEIKPQIHAPATGKGGHESGRDQTLGTCAGSRLGVESGCSAVAVGWACLFPPLSSGGALVAQP